MTIDTQQAHEPKPDPKIALAFIADDDALTDGVLRMLGSVKGKVDGVFLAFTGEDNEVFFEIGAYIAANWPKCHAGVQIGWENDFSLARNASFELVRQYAENNHTTFDWITWLDCDDVFPEAGKSSAPGIDLGNGITAHPPLPNGPEPHAFNSFRDMARLLDSRNAHAGLVNYNYKIEDDGSVTTSHFKERIFRFDFPWLWINPIHENCTGPMGARFIKLPSRQYFINHLRGPAKGKRDRNKDMIKDWYKSNRDNPRAIMFMAHQTLALVEQTAEEPDKVALLKTAFNLYKKFMATSPRPDEGYIVNNLCAEIMRMLGRFEDSINLDLQGIKMQPDWPTSYVSIAQTHFDGESYDEAITWAKKALELKYDDSQLQINDHLEAEYKPLVIIGTSYLRLGHGDDAYSYFKKAVKIRDDDFTCARLNEANELRKKKNQDHDRGNTRSGSDLHKMRWGHAPEKSIAFFVGNTAEDWNPDLLRDGGLGGTETSIIMLAERLALSGMRVVVFGSPGTWDGKIEKKRQGSIEWYSNEYWHPDEPFTTFVALRHPAVFDTPINADQKILWMHDLTIGDARYSEFGDRFSKVDTIVCPSEFHMEHLIRVYEQGEPWSARNMVIANGIDREQFIPTTGAERDQKAVIYASSPDRGLTRLLELWPDIAKEEKFAKLFIYYGWESIDAIIESGHPNGPQLAYFKDTTQKKIAHLQELGYEIYEMGRVDQDTLAVAFEHAGVMAYPANFQETFGIVFAQALTAGMQLVTSDLGALSRMTSARNEVGDLEIGLAAGRLHLVVPGSPDSMEFGDRFVAAVVSAIRDTTPGDRLNLQMTTMNVDWGTVVNGWIEMFQSIDALKVADAALQPNPNSLDAIKKQHIEINVSHSKLRDDRRDRRIALEHEKVLKQEKNS